MANKNTFAISGYIAVVFLTVFLGLSLWKGGDILLRDADIGTHIRVGEKIISEFAIPQTAVFSELEGEVAWTNHSWLSQVIMAIAHNIGGMNAVVLMYSLLIALTYAFLIRWGIEHGGNLHPTSFAWIAFFVVSVGAAHWSARPQQFSMLLLVVFHRIMFLYDCDGSSKAIYTLPLLTAFWANLHVGFSVGLLVVVAYLTWYFSLYLVRKKQGDPCNKKLITVVCVFGACLVFSCINPYGLKIYSLIFKVVGEADFQNTIIEYLSPDFHDPFFRPFLIMLVLSIALLMVSPAKPSPPEIAITCGFTALALYSNRYILFYGVAMAPILFRHASEIPQLSPPNNICFFKSSRAWSGVCIAVIFAVLALSSMGWIRHDWNPKRIPVDAARFIVRENIPGRMFNPEQYAAVLTYTSPGQYKPFMDGRSDVYAGERWKDYLSIGRLNDNWQHLMDDKYRFDWVFYYNNMPLTNALGKMPGKWVRVYSDRLAEVYVRNNEDNRLFLATHPAVEKFVAGKKQ